MRIFISYSEKDRGISHLLAYILEKDRNEVRMDKRIEPGERFDETIQYMITESDAVLLILTENAIKSAWVNQEIGFATALKKHIVPFSLSNDKEFKGMVNYTQSYSNINWDNPNQTIDKLVSALKNQSQYGDKEEYYERFKLNQIVSGKIRRTQVITSLLDKVKLKNETVIYNQAAFSIFCASNSPQYRAAGMHTEEYMELLLKERDLLHQLISVHGVTLKLILWPVRAYKKEFMSTRYENLINWMKEFEHHDNVQYVCAQYIGRNRLIVDNYFCFEGIKLHKNTGYDMSIVKYETQDIKSSIKDFNTVFEQAASKQGYKQKAIHDVEDLQNKLLNRFDQESIS